jgi:hypothetical protein
MYKGACDPTKCTAEDINCFLCYDIECSECKDYSEGSCTNAAGDTTKCVNNSKEKAAGDKGTCICKDGFGR